MPELRAARPAPDVAAHAIELHGVHGASFTLRADGREARVELPLPGLYNVYNALGAAALCLTLGTPLQAVAAALEQVHAAFGRAETIDDRRAPALDPARQEPGGANEVLRTLALEDGDLDVLGVLNDNTADGRDVSWIWDADIEVVAPRIRRATCSGRRAAELALRLKYAGVDPARIDIEPDLDVALDRALADGGRGRPLYALPTYTALLSLRGLLSERGGGAAVLGALMHVPTVWHDLECGALHRRPAAVARGRRARATARSSTSAPARDASRGTSPRAATRSPRSTSTPACSRRSPSATRTSRPSSATRATSTSARSASALILAPMQTVQLLGGATAASRSCAAPVSTSRRAACCPPR